MNATCIRVISLAVLLTPGLSVGTAQDVPDSPAPAPFPDPAWGRLNDLSSGRPIIVTLIDGRSIHCLFAGITDANLFCNPPGNPPGVGFRFDHAEVIAVDLDLPTHRQAPVAQPAHNYHPAWISSMIAGGIIVGLCATRTTDDGTAAKAGIIGAGIVGLIGAPMAFLPHPQIAPPGPAYPPYFYGAHLRFPVRIRNPR